MPSVALQPVVSQKALKIKEKEKEEDKDFKFKKKKIKNWFMEDSNNKKTHNIFTL